VLAKLGAGIEEAEADARVQVSAGKRSTMRMRSEWRLPPPVAPPSLPDRLAWYTQEDSWQRVAIQRMRHGLQSFSLELTHDDDFGVSADIEVRFKKAGLSLRGKFAQHEATTWRLAGEFYPASPQPGSANST
jgi:hypothetical protein